MASALVVVCVRWTHAYGLVMTVRRGRGARGTGSTAWHAVTMPPPSRHCMMHAWIFVFSALVRT